MDRIVVETSGDWLTPVATLIAVVVGGGVNWLVQSHFTKRREDGEAKASARMIAGDLAIAASWLREMVEDDPRWFGFFDLRLPNWDQHAPVIATRLDREGWEAVSQSALELAGITQGMRKALGPGGPHQGKPVLPVGDKDIPTYRTLWANATKAYNWLAPLGGFDPEPRLLHEGQKRVPPP